MVFREGRPEGRPGAPLTFQKQQLRGAPQKLRIFYKETRGAPHLSKTAIEGRPNIGAPLTKNHGNGIVILTFSLQSFSAHKSWGNGIVTLKFSRLQRSKSHTLSRKIKHLGLIPPPFLQKSLVFFLISSPRFEIKIFQTNLKKFL